MAEHRQPCYRPPHSPVVDLVADFLAPTPSAFTRAASMAMSASAPLTLLVEYVEGLDGIRQVRGSGVQRSVVAHIRHRHWTRLQRSDVRSLAIIVINLRWPHVRVRHRPKDPRRFRRRRLQPLQLLQLCTSPMRQAALPTTSKIAMRSSAIALRVQ